MRPNPLMPTRIVTAARLPRPLALVPAHARWSAASGAPAFPAPTLSDDGGRASPPGPGVDRPGSPSVTGRPASRGAAAAAVPVRARADERERFKGRVVRVRGAGRAGVRVRRVRPDRVVVGDRDRGLAARLARVEVED